MCGIVGVAGEISVNFEKAFEQLLLMDVVRGKHSTGVATVNKNSKDVIVAKKAVSSLDFIEMPCFKNALSGVSSVIIGHNRYATVGKVNNNNAHPFEFENVVGVHNGTLNERYNLYNQNKFDTDSESFYSHVNQYGIEDAILNSRGAYCLVWYDKEAKTINFLRNAERPMYIAKVKDKDTVFWASEYWMLLGALGRNGIAHETVELLPENQWLSFEIQDGKVLKPRIKEVKENPPKKFQGTYYGGNTQNTNTTRISNPLSGKKGELLEIKFLVTSHKGLSYFRCYSPSTKQDNIKFYANKEHLQTISVGDWIEADINGFAGADGVVTVDNRTVRKVDLSVGKDNTKNQKNTALEPMHKNHKGTYINKAVWVKQFGECSYCTADIDPVNDDYTLTTDGESFCSACSNSEDVKPFIKTA